MKPARTLFIGRYQPFHKGHKTLIRSVLEEGKDVLIAIRDTELSDENPYSVEERRGMIESALEAYRKRVEIISIPDIDSVAYGRDVGYALREIRLDSDTEAISGTTIRDMFKLDFVGVGTTRAGTTWVHTLLNEHPEICMSSKKETGFFLDEYHKGLGFYAGYFACEGKNGEFDPHYMSKDAADRIHNLFPDAKIIICLKDPIERMYSLHRKHYTKGEVSCSFLRAVQMYPEKYVHPGFTGEYVKYYKQKFDNVLVLHYEDLVRDSRAFIQGIYAFLGVDSTFIPPSLEKNINRARSPRFLLLNRLAYWIERLPSKSLLRSHVSFLKRFGFGLFTKAARRMRSMNTRSGKRVGDGTIPKDARRYLTEVFSKEIAE